MILQLLGTVIFAGLFILAAAWPWIAEEMIIRKREKEEENDDMVYICHCEKCGYTGRISLTRYGHWNRILGEVVWNCPNCGNCLWDEEDVKLVWRDEEEAKIAKLKDKFLQKGGMR